MSGNCPEVQVHVEVGETFRSSATQKPYTDNYNDPTYVTPIDEISQDVEQRLGYTVHLLEVDES